MCTDRNQDCEINFELMKEKSAELAKAINNHNALFFQQQVLDNFGSNPDAFIKAVRAE